MDITDVRVYLKNGQQNLRAFATLTLDHSFAVRDLKVYEGKNGLFVAMPARKLPNGKYLDVAHPVTKEMRRLIQSEVLEAYRKTLSGPGA